MSWMSPLTVPITILPTRGAPVSASKWFEDRTCHAFHGVCGQQNFRDEQDAVAEIVADDCHPADQRLGQNAVGRPIRAPEGC